MLDRLDVRLERVEHLVGRRVLAPDRDRIAADHFKVGQAHLVHGAS
jgi:hypothetical protein